MSLVDTNEDTLVVEIRVKGFLCETCGHEWLQAASHPAYCVQCRSLGSVQDVAEIAVPALKCLKCEFEWFTIVNGQAPSCPRCRYKDDY
jgi:predicted Zn-ribbon and HTH transcriptional regulator